MDPSPRRPSGSTDHDRTPPLGAFVIGVNLLRAALTLASAVDVLRSGDPLDGGGTGWLTVAFGFPFAAFSFLYTLSGFVFGDRGRRRYYGYAAGSALVALGCDLALVLAVRV